MLWDFVLWDFVLRDSVRREFVLWDSVPDYIKQMRGFYARVNSVLRKFAACSFQVKLRL